MRGIDSRDPILHWDMFETMVKYYNPNGDLPQYILGKADEDDYTGFPKSSCTLAEMRFCQNRAGL